MMNTMSTVLFCHEIFSREYPQKVKDAIKKTMSNPQLNGAIYSISQYDHKVFNPENKGFTYDMTIAFFETHGAFPFRVTDSVALPPEITDKRFEVVDVHCDPNVSHSQITIRSGWHREKLDFDMLMELPEITVTLVGRPMNAKEEAELIGINLSKEITEPDLMENVLDFIDSFRKLNKEFGDDEYDGAVEHFRNELKRIKEKK